MKKKIMSKLLAMGTAAILALGSMLPVSAAAQTKPVTVANATEMDQSYFTTLKGTGEVTLAGNPGLTIKKYIHVQNNPSQPDTSQPVSGVEFQYGKIGNLYEVEDGGKKVMAYGIKKEVAVAAGIDMAADYADGTMSYYTNAQTITDGVKGKTLSAFAKTGALTQTGTTDAGQFTATLDAANPYGLYLVAESNTAGATVNGKPVSITKTQAPFVVSIPTYIGAGGTEWEENIVANVKNSMGSASVEKKIVTGADETVKDGSEEVADTDTTSIQDTVHFRLKGTIPSIPAEGEAITSYVLTDHSSKGLDPVTGAGGAVAIDGVRITGDNTVTTLDPADYIVSTPAQNIDASSEFAGGKTFTITLTETGLKKLTQVAKATADPQAEKAVYFYYSAKVNENAVIGANAPGAAEKSGNPNEVKLSYKVGQGAEIATDYDKVTVFTFGMNIKKMLDGQNITAQTANRDSIQFILYSTLPAGGNTYYQLTGTNGVYKMSAATTAVEAEATKMTPDENGQIQILGLEEGTYSLKEIQTVPGYNLLKEPASFTLTAAKGANTYVDAKSAADYTGALDKGEITLEINNLSGFRLPATGGIGAGIFAVCGVLVIGAGIAFFVISRKKEHSSK